MGKRDKEHRKKVKARNQRMKGLFQRQVNMAYEKHELWKKEKELNEEDKEREDALDLDQDEKNEELDLDIRLEKITKVLEEIGDISYYVARILDELFYKLTPFFETSTFELFSYQFAQCNA